MYSCRELCVYQYTYGAVDYEIIFYCESLDIKATVSDKQNTIMQENEESGNFEQIMREDSQGMIFHPEEDIKLSSAGIVPISPLWRP